jgi:hypothetical protein
VPLPTFPARGFVAAGGAAVLLDHVTEYELVHGGSELALTLLRSVGLISRNTNPYRVEPAGPEVEIPGAQGIGPVSAAMAVLPFQGSWADAGVAAQAERYRHDLVAAQGRGPEGPLNAACGSSPTAVRSCRRCAAAEAGWSCAWSASTPTLAPPPSAARSAVPAPATSSAARAHPCPPPTARSTSTSVPGRSAPSSSAEGPRPTASRHPVGAGDSHLADAARARMWRGCGPADWIPGHRQALHSVHRSPYPVHGHAGSIRRRLRPCQT